MMKKRRLILLTLLLSAAAWDCPARAQEKSTATAKQEDGAVIRRGQALTGAPSVTLETLSTLR